MSSRNFEKSLSFFTNSKWQPLVVFAAAVLLYSNTLRHGFALDDKVVFTENQFVQKGISGIGEILRFDSFRGYFKDESSAKLVAGGRYRPLTLIIFSCIVETFGNNPFIAHCINVLLFALTGVVLYRVAYKILNYKYKESAGLLAFFVSLIFVLHPIHTEAVANIKGLDEILSLLLSLLAGLFLLHYIEAKKTLHLLFAGLLYLMALYSKESAIAFVAIYPLCYYLLIKGKHSFSTKASLAFLMPPLVYIIHRTSVIGKFNALASSEDFLNNNFLIMRGERLLEMNVFDRLGVIFYTLVKYIQLLVFPYPLTHDYNPKVIPVQTVFSPLPLLGVTMFLLMIAMTAWYWKKKPLISLGLGIFIAALLPVSNLLFPIGTAMAERFIYTSSVGFCLVASYFLLQLMNSRKIVAVSLMSLLAVGYSAQALYRNTAWKDDLTLFNRDYKYSSNSAKLNSALGLALLNAYRNSSKKEEESGKLDQAIFYLEKALKIFPAYYQCLFLLGNAHYLKKDYEAALKTYEKYIEKNPADVSVIKNYQKSLREHGRNLVHNQKKYEEAKVELLKALKLAPNDAHTLELLGIAEAEIGYLDNSINYLKKAVELEPNNATAWANLYISYSRKGDKYSAQYAVQKAMELDKEVIKKLMTVEVK